MSLTNFKEVKCPCGAVFIAEVWTSINVEQNPELKEILVSGELNVMRCPECGGIFYTENFLLYIDIKEELIAFVYPISYSSERDVWQKKMEDDFQKAIESIDNPGKINFPPVIFFGLDELVHLLRNEELLMDEILVFENIKHELKLESIRISRNLARKNEIPYILPCQDENYERIEEKVIGGLRKLISFMPDLTMYKRALEVIEKDSSILYK